MRAKDIKEGMVVRITRDGSPCTTTHLNVGAVARVVAAGYVGVDGTVRMWMCKRIDGGPEWAASDGMRGHGFDERGFYDNELEPIDAGIAHLYGVDPT